MGSKKGTTKQDQAEGTITITVTGEMAARIAKLWEDRHLAAQTLEDVTDAVVRQGTKTLEKRRKETQDGAIERAKAVLAKAGITA